MGILRLLIPAVVALLAATPSHSQERREVPDFRFYGTPASAQDADAIDLLIADYKGSWGAQDVEGLADLHSEDVEWINAYARMFQGREALAEFLRDRLFPAFEPAVSREEASNMRTVSIRYLGDDAAIVHMYTDGNRGASRNEGEDMRRTHLHLVLGKVGNRWQVVHTAIMDAR